MPKFKKSKYMACKHNCSDYALNYSEIKYHKSPPFGLVAAACEQ